ncbi:MAG TPA: PAS domain-containing protein, partial [Ilumatobacteraceae bacterium]|nr:PAS domain-containing protein [Ilumatobacteraceae bacterium]
MTMTGAASVTASEAGFRLIAESIPHIVWTAAPDGSTEYFNRQATTYAGSRVKTTYGWDWLALVHPDDADQASSTWKLAVRTHTPYHLDLRIRRSDGKYRWHAFHCLPIRDADGALLKWICTATDIDDAKVVEGDLRCAERRSAEQLQLLELLPSKAPVGFGFIDREFRIRHMNESLAAASGGTASAQIGRTIQEVVPEMWPTLEQSYRHVLEEGQATIDVEIDGPSTVDPADRHRYLTSHYPVALKGEIIGIGI